jgi:ferredoxin/coenzyme F420-reducing hydrogenase delta subunit
MPPPPSLSADVPALPPAHRAPVPVERGPLTAPVRGEPLLRRLELLFLHLDRLLGRTLPESLNPFLQTGAVATTSLLVATATGVVLLLWYRPSVHAAYESVAAMSAAPWTAGLMRSLHRYSSDACMFFIGVHALRVFVERRFSGPRWLAWVTGLLSLSVVWITGWTGYWLVWDARAQHVAVGTARMIDTIPIFTDPLSRSFLTDASVNSLLFFVVFFIHMLIPLAIGVLLWLHLTRLSRPRFLTRTPMTVWLVGSLVVLSALRPAESAEPARMTALWGEFTIDAWYLAPLWFTDRLEGGALWALTLVGGALALSVPWMLGKQRRRVAEVDAVRCNACTQCYQDCPFEAIRMVPRTVGRERFGLQAEVNPDLCTGCGICAGSCDPNAIGLDWLDTATERRRLEAWVNADRERGEQPFVALVCGESAAAGLEIDEQSGLCPELPGYRVLALPCGGWTHMITVERLLRRGAEGVAIVTCAPGDCRSREGDEWLRQRLAGERDPGLRSEKVDPERVRILALNRTSRATLLREAAAFRAGRGSSLGPAPGRALAGATAFLVALLVAGVVYVGSDVGYAAPVPHGSELVVSLKHPGHVSEQCRTLSEEEKLALPVHMRRDEICERQRLPVRLRVRVDGEVVRQMTIEPAGLWGDMSSVAFERFPVATGARHVEVAIGDTADPEEWGHAEERTLEFREDARRVVLFDRASGFVWE